MAAQMPRQNGLVDVAALLDNLAPANQHVFLQPPPAIPTASLQIVKETLDAFAGQVSDEQLQRLKDANKNKKRKRDGAAAAPIEVLKIRKVYLDGFETGQVWQQARKIIQSALDHSEATLQELEENDEVVVVNGVQGEEEALDSDEDVSDLNSDEQEELGSEGEEDGHSLSDGSEEDLELDEDGLEDDVAEEEMMDDIGEDGDEMREGEEDDDDDGSDGPADVYVEDPHGLNDGFFSIDDFNRQTQWFEEQDARGDPNTDAVSEEEEIDWTADPLTATATKGKKQGAGAEEDDWEDEAGDDGSDDEEGGPTFGDMDLYAPEGESEDEDMDDDVPEDTEFNANDIHYKDFFAPPPRKVSKDKQKKSVSFKPKPIADEDVERAMDDVRRDLFDDDSDHGEDSDDALSEVSASDPRSRRSAHERRQAKLAEEIRQLEAAAVAKREWTLSGEASAVDRPVNSLLQQDLDFEHGGKPVPVITTEVTDSIEDLIKRRILAQDFDEVLRRRPDAPALSSGTRRGLVELEDTKSSKGLADLYEEDYNKRADPEGYVSKADEQMRKEEAEIARMWKDLSATLDALSSWHYRPRPAEPGLTVVTDAATISMEDAQPATAQGVAGAESSLAPQEVYKAGADKDAVEKGEVVAKSGLPVARAEMTREEKRRLRRREKERVRRAGGVDGAAAAAAGTGTGAGDAGKRPMSRRAKMQKETLADLKKGGVKVINRKGEVVDMAGNKAKPEAKMSSTGFKL
ncbi:U3 small nucleolar ribonucleo protein complex, subunit Mpp10p [Sodiomyces alkalinus F11]|uniref:U3 small nucleolar ribonucleoprotein protein MPP10 n=1 Tax=Sodiomyces alkalinus (strain CBS 110278 / VKM F-3762 / F11) TaxID=1314773 RepID=A0A3N2Q3S3_SODAK|nr:U3 small nucleolar ribonucleo protein complex, subunit Mpp10p [Sodiomyces alkalinus F11]ROT41402.1 U3 small nucleolar ribonucleo protein complex, subunit Mpp10p [Sodiomyces alkalinus F11]